MEIVRNHSLKQLSCIIYSSVSYLYHVVYHIPSTYPVTRCFIVFILLVRKSDSVMLNNCPRFYGYKGTGQARFTPGNPILGQCSYSLLDITSEKNLQTQIVQNSRSDTHLKKNLLTEQYY